MGVFDLSEIVVIAIAGGPGTGKSSVFADLRKRYEGRAVFVSEAATDLVRERGLTPPFVGDALRAFEYDVTILQRQREEGAKRFGRERGIRFVISDRGTVDHPAYLPGGWEEYEALMGTTRAEEYARYTYAVLLEMPTRSIYERIRRNNDTRHEDYSQAYERGRRLEQMWAAHPNLYRISATDEWSQKRRLVRRIVSQIIDVRLA